MISRFQVLLWKMLKTGEISEHEFGGIFIYVGVDPVSKMIEGTWVLQMRLVGLLQMTT